MPTTFHMADDEERKWVDYALRQWHKELLDAAVRVGVIFAHNPEGNAVSHGGYPAAATIKPMSLKERVAKGYDAEMLVDEDNWERLTDQEKTALADHELSHIRPIPKTDRELKKNPLSPWRKDDIGRPKLRSVKGDFSAGDGFKSVIERHGENSAEFANLKTCWRIAETAAGQIETTAEVA